MNNKWKQTVAVILILGAGSVANAGFQVDFGNNNFHVSVGRYDYYPYETRQGYSPRIDFYDVMSDYGDWVYVQPFGRVWRPYADYNWRPYLYGH